jgi:hypothetical protein
MRKSLLSHVYVCFKVIVYSFFIRMCIHDLRSSFYLIMFINGLRGSSLDGHVYPWTSKLLYTQPFLSVIRFFFTQPLYPWIQKFVFTGPCLSMDFEALLYSTMFINKLWGYFSLNRVHPWTSRFLLYELSIQNIFIFLWPKSKHDIVLFKFVLYFIMFYMELLWPLQTICLA